MQFPQLGSCGRNVKKKKDETCCVNLETLKSTFSVPVLLRNEAFFLQRTFVSSKNVMSLLQAVLLSDKLL